MAVYVVTKSKIAELHADPDNMFPFRFKRGGTEYTIPKLGYVSRESSRILQNTVGVNGIELFRRVVAVESPEAFEVLDVLEDDQVGDLADVWVKASGVDVEQEHTDS